MPYVSRDEAGRITGVFDHAEVGVTDQVRADDPDLVDERGRLSDLAVEVHVGAAGESDPCEQRQPHSRTEYITRPEWEGLVQGFE